MSGDTVFVFALIGVTAALMASNRIRFDVIALLVVLALMLSGVLTVPEALSGFGSSVVILVAGLLVIGDMLDRTGVAAAMGDWILKKGGSNEIRLLIVVMAAAGVLGAVMSSTAIVAIFIPIVLRIAGETGISASRLLMPMSYAALISGMLTLIATTPNLVVSEELKYSGYQEFGFFSFTLIGLAVLVVSIVYMVLIGRRLLPSEAKSPRPGRLRRSLFEMWEDFRAEAHYQSLRIGPGSPLVGKSLAEAQIETLYRLRVLGILRKTSGGGERISSPGPGTEFRVGDAMVVVGPVTGHERLIAQQSVSPFIVSDRDRQRWMWELGGASVLIHPESTLTGKSLREAEFRTHYGLHVVGLRRGQEAVADFEDVELAASDSLLVIGPWSGVQTLSSQHHDFVMLETPAEYKEVVPAYTRMPVSLIILASMVLLSIFDVVPLVAAVIMAALAAVFSRCLSMEDSYRAIHWSSLVLVAGMLPLADALEMTGGTKIIVDALMQGVGDSGPRVMMTVLFFLTAVVGLFLSNTAAAVLVAPIAIIAAEALGVSPYPFAVAVLIAASAAFVTPVSTPVVTLVVEPGRYGFMDFVKVGTPLLILAYVVTLVVTPLIFPFGAS